MNRECIDAIGLAFDEGKVIPYLGPGVLALGSDGDQLPASPLALVKRLTAKSSVPYKIKNNLTAAAQFIENFKHRRTVSKAMTEAFGADAQPNKLHLLLMGIPALPLVIHAWYDDLPQKALRARSNWGMAQGVSQSEHFGNWVHYFSPDGTLAGDKPGSLQSEWETLLYQPLGSVWPAHNYLVSDSDFVEVLTEIDIQTPIPEAVQQIRKGKSFLFLGCRFAEQMDRLFAWETMKRSSEKHWAVLPEEPTRNEARFLVKYNVERIPISLDDFVAEFAAKQQATELSLSQTCAVQAP
jgi:hypothetical protein